jgi:pimeloyl-ACP methyl ester carboxylesterase
LPLVLTHGWPGSVLEFEKVIRPLTEPDDPADAFHVVVPSLPGYGFSDRPTEPGWTVRRIAAAWRELMARLGYERYGAQGSDWGTSVTTSMGQQDTGQLAGIHVMPPIAAPDPATFDDLTSAEEAALADLRHAEADASGYAEQMTTRPQTVGYGLTDSPAGLCAWIVEKFAAWTDSGGRPETVLTRDELLDDITLYWLTRTATSSARLYWESFREVSEWFARATADTVTVPTGCSIFPKEMPRPSRRWAANRYTDIRYWGEPDRGGHFAAFEQPGLFVDEVRGFFRLVR